MTTATPAPARSPDKGRLFDWKLLLGTLAVAGLLSMAVAVWAILGGPVITPTVLLAGGLVLTVVVGLLMVIRR